MELIAFSALADYWSCPRLYHYRHELRLPQPAHDNALRRRGNWIHQQLDLHAQGLTPLLASDAAEAAVWRAYTDAIGPYAGWQCFSEWSCHVPLTLGGRRVWLHGRMDRLYLRDTSLILLDFKTGEVPGPLAGLQLDFYAWLLWQARERLAPFASLTARVLPLSDPASGEIRAYTPAQLEALAATFLPTLEALLDSASRDVPAPRSVAGEPWCTMCEYQRLCPEGSYYAH